MDCEKTGMLIRALRAQQGLTQKQVADALGVSPKTVSKWECGQGCPELSLWRELAILLGVDVEQLMEGELKQNRPDSGNLSRARFYVCPCCGNVLFSTGPSGIHCCGYRLEPLKPTEEDLPGLRVEEIDMEYYLTFDHPMTKEHHILFVAYVKTDRIILQRLYPEQEAEIRLPMQRGGTLYLCCSRHGLVRYKKPF